MLTSQLCPKDCGMETLYIDKELKKINTDDLKKSCLFFYRTKWLKTLQVKDVNEIGLKIQMPNTVRTGLLFAPSFATSL